MKHSNCGFDHIDVKVKHISLFRKNYRFSIFFFFFQFNWIIFPFSCLLRVCVCVRFVKSLVHMAKQQKMHYECRCRNTNDVQSFNMFGKKKKQNFALNTLCFKKFVFDARCVCVCVCVCRSNILLNVTKCTGNVLFITEHCSVEPAHKKMMKIIEEFA